MLSVCESRILAEDLVVLGHGLRLLALGGRGLLGGGGLGLLGLGDQHGVDVGENTTLGDGHTAEQLVELLVVAHGQLDVAGNDAGLLVVAGGVAGELEHLSGEVLEDGGEVHGGTGTDAGGVFALLQVAADTADGELQTSLGGLGLALLAGGAATGLTPLSSLRNRLGR
jgi:hypothetical protein